MSYIQDMFNILTVNCPIGTRTVISRAKLVELQALNKLQKHVSTLFFQLVLWITETLFLYYLWRYSREQKKSSCSQINKFTMTKGRSNLLIVFLAGSFHFSGHSKMIPESLQLLSKAFAAIQQKDSYLTNLSSKQTYSTLFTLPTTGTVTTAFDKDMLLCRFNAFTFLIKK